MKRILILFAAMLAVNSVTFANPFSNADQISIEKNLRPVVVNPTVRGVHGRISNCNEWISLRSYPSTSASRLDTIPLGAYVEYLGPAENGFYKIRYHGQVGYGLRQYLAIR